MTFCPIKSSFASAASSVSRPCAHAASCFVRAPAFLKLRPQPRRHGSFEKFYIVRGVADARDASFNPIAVAGNVSKHELAHG